MDDKQRTELIRKGNAAFNDGKVDVAAQIFKTTGYKDGLIRVGDYYYFEREQPLLAYGYYRRAGHTKMLEKLGDAFIFALKCWLADEPSQKEENPPSQNPNQNQTGKSGQEQTPGQKFSDE